MRREKLEHHVTAGMIKGKQSMENSEKRFGWTKKVVKCKASDRCTKGNEK